MIRITKAEAFRLFLRRNNWTEEIAAEKLKTTPYYIRKAKIDGDFGSLFMTVPAISKIADTLTGPEVVWILRYRAGLSLQAVADIAGYSRMTVNNIESGRGGDPYPLIVMLMEYLEHAGEPVELLVLGKI